MKKLLILFFGLLAGSQAYAQQSQVIRFTDFERLTNFSSANDTTYVINFWATWCHPCVQELPNFEQLGSSYKGKKVKVILISMDFVKQQDKLNDYITKHNIQSQVYLLNEHDYNSWIDKVDPNWSGSIPGTLVINSAAKYRKFYEQEFTYDELEKTIKPIIR